MNRARSIWRAPAALALVTLVSLVGALVADGIWDQTAALALFGVLAFAFGKGWR